MNRVMLIGRLADDPQLKQFTDSSVCNFTVVTSDKWKGKDGKENEKTEFNRVVAWGKLAMTCNNYLAKGRQCFIEGSLQTRSWEDKQGNKKYTTEIKATNVVFLGSKTQEEPKSGTGDVFDDWSPDTPTVDSIPF